MSRPIQAIIHLAHLRHNLMIARRHVPESQVFAVVKANAYGHGIERVYPALHDADGFALLDMSEAQCLRSLGWQGKILLLEGIFRAQDLLLCASLQLSFTVHSQQQLQWLNAFVVQAEPDVKFDVYLKMNSGMNRLGFSPKQYRQCWQQLQTFSCVNSVTHTMHFSDADAERFGQDSIAEQLQVFEHTIAGLVGPRSVSNSAAILRYGSKLQSDVVRSGIMLYGGSPDYPTHQIKDWKLKPSMRLRSEIIAIQELQRGQTVGYGSQFTAPHTMRIGIVACGYADGYQRISATGTPVLVDAIRTQLVGRVSMDMLAVDLSLIPSAEIGSEVVLWGAFTTRCNFADR